MFIIYAFTRYAFTRSAQALRSRTGRRFVVALGMAAASATSMLGQASAPSVSPRNSTTDITGSTVTLSPFEVSTSKDVGFVASSSLAGGRLAGELRYTPAAYSVLTR